MKALGGTCRLAVQLGCSVTTKLYASVKARRYCSRLRNKVIFFNVKARGELKHMLRHDENVLIQTINTVNRNLSGIPGDSTSIPSHFITYYDPQCEYDSLQALPIVLTQ